VIKIHSQIDKIRIDLSHRVTQKWNMLFLLAFLLLFGVPAQAQTAPEIALVKSTMAQLQLKSIAENREYCGYLIENGRGVLKMTRARKGRKNSCAPRPPNAWLNIIASYHTHGAFSRDSMSEFPSLSDVNADIKDGVDGYVATPGGRLWLIDTRAGEIRQICGIGCLPSDPTFVAGLDGPIKRRYSFDQLAQIVPE